MNKILLVVMLFLVGVVSANDIVEITEPDMLFENIGRKVVISKGLLDSVNRSFKSNNYSSYELNKSTAGNDFVTGYLCFGISSKSYIYEQYDHTQSQSVLVQELNGNAWKKPKFQVSNNLTLFNDFDLQLAMRLKSKMFYISLGDQKTSSNEYNDKVEKLAFDLYSGYASSAFWNSHINNHEPEKIHYWMISGIPEFDVSLCYAVYLNNVDFVKLLLAKGAKVESCPMGKFQRNHPLSIQLASQNGNAEILALLLKSIPVYCSNPYGSSFSPVVTAAANGNLECLKLLYENGYSLSEVNNYGNSALHRAVKQNNIEVVEYLLDCGVRPFTENNKDETPIDIARKYDVDSMILELLVYAKENPPAEVLELLEYSKQYREKYYKDNQFTPADNSETDNENAEQEQLDQPEFINEVAPASRSSRQKPGMDYLVYELFNAAQAGDLAIVEHLISKGVDINSRVDLNENIFDFAYITSDISYEDQTEISDDIPRNSTGDSALLLACKNNHFEVAKTLLAAGAEVNIKNINADYPLFYAVMNDNFDLLKLLLTYGADINFAPRPYEEYLTKYDDIHDKDPNAVRIQLPPIDYSKRYIIRAAIHIKNIEIVKFILDSGAIPDFVYSENNGSKILIDYARENGNDDIADLIESYLK